MNRWVSRVLVVALLLTVTASAANAQRRRRAIVTQTGPRFGVHAGFDFSNGGNALLGAQLSWPIMPSLDFYPSFDYYFVSAGSLWSLNFDLKYRPPTVYRAWYVGGGLNWSHASAGSNTGLNLFSGLEGRRGNVRPYVEARFILENNSTFQVAAGLSWR